MIMTRPEPPVTARCQASRSAPASPSRPASTPLRRSGRTERPGRTERSGGTERTVAGCRSDLSRSCWRKIARWNSCVRGEGSVPSSSASLSRSARSGRGATAQPAAPFKETNQEHDRDQLGPDAEEQEVTEADLQMSDRPGEVLPEESGQEAQGQKNGGDH